MITLGYQNNLDCYNIFSLPFSIQFSWRVSHIIQLLLDHLDPTFIDRLSSYLSTCPIRHPLGLSASCGSQSSIVQRSSPHKCGQKSSCNAFNAMVVVLPQIFLVSFLLVCSRSMFLSLEHSSYPRRSSSLNRLPLVPQL